METEDRSSADEVEDPPEADRPLVRTHETSEERTVFTEPGNGDGWIATDLTVEPTR